MKKLLKLGTRKSLLAWSQSQWVADQLVRFHPDLEVELVGIETQGDRILDIPLQKIEGKEFFVAEIDQALREERVDFTVHSLKDLSLDRPEDFHCFIPKRKDPRDIVIFSPSIWERLESAQPIRVGTSSPRRLQNIPSLLESLLPTRDPAPLAFVEIRGNVNTRLKRLHSYLTPDDRLLDAVVLAFAGLSRLWENPAGRKELQALLQGTRWMVLPLRECPTAPGQGALQVECRQSDLGLQSKLRSLHDLFSERQVREERTVLKEFGGGCHQRFGATVVGEWMFIRGEAADRRILDQCRWNRPPSPKPEARFWDGSKRSSFENIALEAVIPKKEAYFVAHSRAVPPGEELKNQRIWTSGIESWKKLARQGLWVEGCAEGLGFDSIRPLLEEPLLQLPSLDRWIALTHSSALSGWEERGILSIPTYELKPVKLSEMNLRELRQATHVYWHSSSQFDALSSECAEGVVHCCGVGKTLETLTKAGVNPLGFPSAEEWKKWISPSAE